MKNSLITRSINLEKLEEIFNSDSLITDIETIKEIISFIDPEALQKVVSVDDQGDNSQKGDNANLEEKENKENEDVIPEAEKQEIIELIEQELQKKTEETEEDEQEKE